MDLNTLIYLGPYFVIFAVVYVLSVKRLFKKTSGHNSTTDIDPDTYDPTHPIPPRMRSAPTYSDSSDNCDLPSIDSEGCDGSSSDDF